MKADITSPQKTLCLPPFAPPAGEVCELLRSVSDVKEERNLRCLLVVGNRGGTLRGSSGPQGMCVFAELLVCNVMIPGSLAPAC